MNDVIYEYGCEVTSTVECPLNEEIRADERAKILNELIDISHHCLDVTELRSVMIDMRNSNK